MWLDGQVQDQILTDFSQTDHVYFEERDKCMDFISLNIIQ